MGVEGVVQSYGLVETRCPFIRGSPSCSRPLQSQEGANPTALVMHEEHKNITLPIHLAPDHPPEPRGTRDHDDEKHKGLSGSEGYPTTTSKKQILLKSATGWLLCIGAWWPRYLADGECAGYNELKRGCRYCGKAVDAMVSDDGFGLAVHMTGEVGKED